MDFNLYLQYAPVSSAIFAITIAASLYVLGKPELHRNLMLHPYSLTRGQRWYTLITSGFIHADLGHLILNMFTFYFFAFFLEIMMLKEMHGNMMAHVVFGIIYLGSMMLADISSIYKHRNNPGYFSLGASGAIAAILFSSILFNPRGEISLLYLPFGVPAPVFAVLYLAFTYYSSRKQYDNINHEAHLWGAVAGLVLTIIFFPGILPEFVEGVKGLINDYLPSR
jgi:membrane associated rhomboid family serine protease